MVKEQIDKILIRFCLCLEAKLTHAKTFIGTGFTTSACRDSDADIGRSDAVHFMNCESDTISIIAIQRRNAINPSIGHVIGDETIEIKLILVHLDQRTPNIARLIESAFLIGWVWCNPIHIRFRIKHVNRSIYKRLLRLEIIIKIGITDKVIISWESASLVR